MRLRIVVPASLLAALAVTGGAGAVSAAPEHSAVLTINATPDPIFAGDGVLIYGQLNGAEPDGKTVVLHRQLGPGGIFATEGSTFTNAEGFYDFARDEGIVTTTRSWYVTSPGGLRSRTVHESVAALITLAASETESETNRPLTFSGAVYPNVHAGETVFLQEQTAVTGDGWSTIDQGVIDTSSSYAIRRSFLQPGLFELRTLLGGDKRNMAASSDPVTVVIQQAENPAFTINTSEPTIDIGQSVTISGVLYDTGSITVPLPATSVSLWGHTAGGTYVRIASTITGSDGSFSFTQTPSLNETYQVRTTFLPPPRRNTAQLFEGVGDVVSLAASSTTAMVGGTVNLTGTVTPNKAGHVVYLERLGSDTRFRIVMTGVVATGSTYSFTWTFGSAGTKVFRVLVTGGEANIGGVSPTVTVAVSGVVPVQSLPPAS
ncbi:MAG: hypothetical protein ABSF89_16420 [Acidimicrobiales bacterium]